MEKKNTLVITVLAVVVLLVLVLTATFAYFAATIQGQGNTGNVLNVNASLEASNDIFLVTSNGNIAVSVNATQMGQSEDQIKTAEQVANSESTNTSASTQDLTVSYTAAGGTMYYDLMFEWTSTDVYNKGSFDLATVGSKEITLTLTSAADTYQGINLAVNAEKNIASAAGTTTTVTGIIPTVGGTTPVILGHASITSSGNTATVQKYVATASIYNVDIDQSNTAAKDNDQDISGKTFIGRIYVDSVSDKAHTHSELS